MIFQQRFAILFSWIKPLHSLFIKFDRKEKNMAETCRPSKPVSKAGKTLATSKSPSAKSKAGKTLANHKEAKH